MTIEWNSSISGLTGPMVIRITATRPVESIIMLQWENS